MKKTILLLVLSVGLVPTLLGQSSLNNRDNRGPIQPQSQIDCTPNAGRNHVFIHKFTPNNNYDFVGYMELNTRGCAVQLFDGGSKRNSGELAVVGASRNF